MAKDKSKVKSYDVDFDGYDEKEGTGYDGEVPKKGIYSGELVSLREHTTSDTALEWQFEITEGDFKGWRGWVYSDLANAKWKTQQITKAINGGEEKKTSLKPVAAGGDGTSSPTVKTAKAVRLRLINETYEEEKRAKIRTVMPADENTKKSKSDKKKKSKGDDPF